MGINFSAEQRAVIDTRHKNLLVSAAAGSGKTAVLIERIISRITEDGGPDIDSILVVTFTRAAAAEMKERLSKKLDELLIQTPDDANLRRQSVKVHHALVCTIDSFCGYVIKNYFHMTDLDPACRTIEQEESEFIQNEVVGELLGDEYAKEDNEAFINLAMDYFPGKSDKKLEKQITELYKKASAAPQPEKWLAGCAEKWNAVDGEAAPEFLTEMIKDVKQQLEYAKILAKNNLALALEPGGAICYKENFESDLALIEAFPETEDIDELGNAMAAAKFSTLSRKGAKDVPDEVKEEAKKRREEIKNLINAVSKECKSLNIKAVRTEMKRTAPYVGELVRLTIEFGRRFSEKKLSMGLCDFADLEHYAMNILLEEQEDGTLARTTAAKELAAKFSEVMIDEYQDSNQIQECILAAVSGVEDGINDRFMVGDVKQSIYSFRQACPDIFLEKYKEFAGLREGSQRIDLHDNYRSRHQVTDSANLICGKVMIPELGGITYDENAALSPKGSFPDNGESDIYKTEIILLDNKDPAFEEDDAPTKAEAEAQLVADRIKSIVGKMPVFDGGTGEYRKASYRDIVLMFRASGSFSTFSKVLAENGISSYAASKNGYFETQEVRTVLSYLRILDNPNQDIPLAAVLSSPIGGFSSEEMAKICIGQEKENLYTACKSYAGEEKLEMKLVRFLRQYEDLRRLVQYVPVHELIKEVCDRTGYLLYASAMPAGEQREANLKMLIVKAEAFENTGSRSLFMFIRYLEKLEKYSIDDGEVNLFAEGADTVRLMTIHASKGLEFPIVFLCSADHGFNLMDAKSEILVHAKHGIGLKAVVRSERKKAETAYRSFISRQIKLDQISEELRVLYVALTRPKEKLIITGCTNIESKIKKCAQYAPFIEETVPFSVASKAGSYLDWMLMALAKQTCLSKFYREYGEIDFGCDDSGIINIRREAVGRLRKRKAARELKESLIKLMLPDEKEPQGSYDKKTADILNRIGSFNYPYADRASIPGKITVSQLKRMGLNLYEEDMAEVTAREPVVVPYLPEFAKEEGADKLSGAAKGTLYHSVFEKLDLCGTDADAPDKQVFADIKAQIDEMAKNGRFSEEEKKSIWIKEFVSFVRSDIGRRMARAQKAGLLKREQPFTFSAPAGELIEGLTKEEAVLVQGIIDAYFYEDGELVIVDYKTDFVDGDGHELVDKYGGQLYYYERALEAATGLKVKEKIIYSTYLSKEISIK